MIIRETSEISRKKTSAFIWLLGFSALSFSITRNEGSLSGQFHILVLVSFTFWAEDIGVWVFRTEGRS